MPDVPQAEISRFVRKFPDRCCAEVSRRGTSEPCDLTAVAVAFSTEAYDPGWWPVCRRHVRGRELVSLQDVLAAAVSGANKTGAEGREEKP